LDSTDARINKRLKGKEVKGNTTSHVLEYSSDLGGSWQPQKAQSEKRSQLESALLACIGSNKALSFR